MFYTLIQCTVLFMFYTREERIWHSPVCYPCFKFWHSALCCFCSTQGRECDTLHCMLSMISFTLDWREFDTVQNAVHVFLYTTEERIGHSAVCCPCLHFDTVHCAFYVLHYGGENLTQCSVLSMQPITASSTPSPSMSAVRILLIQSEVANLSSNCKQTNCKNKYQYFNQYY